MKKITIIVTAAASAILAGCAMEEPIQTSKTRTVLTVSMGEMTKTTIGELSEGTRPIYWADGDCISINGLESDALTDVPEQTKQMDFVFQSAPSAPYKTLYPASYYKNENTVNLPSVAGTLTIPMASQGLALKPLTGVLKITVTQGDEPVDIAQISVTSPSAQLSGDFTINYANATISGTDSSEEAKTVTSKNIFRITGETPFETFIPVPAGTYNFSVTVMDVDGNYMTKSTSGAKTIKNGQISALEAFSFNPTGTKTADIEIASAEEFVMFAKKSNAGDYEDKPWIVAKLTKDITFDAATSKELRDEGGIGVAADSSMSRFVDHYFNGTFDGQGHSIKSYISYETAKNKAGDADSIVVWTPLFNYTGSNSAIKNLVIDSSCDIKCPKGGFGALAFRVKGLVENITCNADINIDFIAGNANIGGIVGRIYGGTVRSCTMNGNILNSTTSSTSKPWKVGGISGTVENGGIIENCSLNGYILWGTGSGGSGPRYSGEFWAGGIVGHVIDGTVTLCKVNKTDDPIDIRGKDGIKGYIGGIAGQVSETSSITGCDFNRKTYVRSTGQTGEGTLNYIGGIAGWNQGSVSGCNNASEIGGNISQETLALGGIVGKNDGEITSCGNSGQIIGPSQYAYTEYAYVGGIVGWTTKGLSDLTNDGEVYWKPGFVEEAKISKDKPAQYGNLKNVVRSCGGVVGYAEDEITLDRLANNGNVVYTKIDKLNGSGCILGGIIGYINGPVTLSGSTNNGYVYNDNFDNSYSTMVAAGNLGGIAGVAYGTDTKTATITNCTNNKEMGCRRGIVGGIVAWAKNVNITDCINYGGTENAQMSGTAKENISAFLGGIAGKADAQTLISNCKVENIKLCYKPKTTEGGVTGGIVGALLDESSRIVGCTAKNIAIEPQTDDYEDDCLKGGIAGSSVQDAWIHSCRFCGTYGIKGEDPEELSIFDICSDTNFDDDGNNEIIEE